MSLRRMSIQGLHRCPKACKAALVLDSSAGWKLRIALTREEAHRVAGELLVESNHPACRCHTNSLYAVIENLLVRIGGEITGVVLDVSARDMVTATLRMRTGAVETSTLCHTADALALAIRLHAPVFATETLVKLVEVKGARVRQDSLPAEEETAPWLNRVEPIDFSL